MSGAPARASRPWLALREPADAGARAAELAVRAARLLSPGAPAVIHDLGAGTGSMARWLAPRLPGPQHWVLTDRDPDLLPLAAGAPPVRAADGTPVSVETRLRDLAEVPAAELAGAALVTASALLDMLAAADLDRLVGTCLRAGRPTLLSLSVTGRVALEPTDPLDTPLAEAFNAHQRRLVAGHPLLGPDAAGAAADRFTRAGWRVLVRPSPWRLSAGYADLAAEWLTGWVSAACEQRPDLRAATGPYLWRRLAQAAGGRLEVTVDHQDLLAWPAGGR